MNKSPDQRHIGRSIGAVVAGFVVVVVLSLGTDMLLVMAGVLPPFDQPSLLTNRLLVLATVYRTIYSVAGSYLTARLAPDRPMAHALILGTIGLVVSTLGAVVMRGHGPAWYPWTLVVLALPGAWLGGILYNPRARTEP